MELHPRSGLTQARNIPQKQILGWKWEKLQQNQPNTSQGYAVLEERAEEPEEKDELRSSGPARLVSGC